MIKKLDLIFESVTECKEKGYSCKMSKNNVIKIYKPDAGIKKKELEDKLFTKYPPKLCDCVTLYNSDRIALIEIKCGKVTQSILKDVIEKLNNTFEILRDQKVAVTKCILLYKKFEDNQMKKLLASKRIYDQPLLAKKYENKAIDI